MTNYRTRPVHCCFHLLHEAVALSVENVDVIVMPPVMSMMTATPGFADLPEPLAQGMAAKGAACLTLNMEMDLVATRVHEYQQQYVGVRGCLVESPHWKEDEVPQLGALPHCVAVMTALCCFPLLIRMVVGFLGQDSTAQPADIAAVLWQAELRVHQQAAENHLAVAVVATLGHSRQPQNIVACRYMVSREHPPLFEPCLLAFEARPGAPLLLKC